MMRILPGKISECSGPQLSAMAGTIGFHPGEKNVTPLPLEDRALLSSDNASVMSVNGFAYGLIFDPYQNISPPLRFRSDFPNMANYLGCVFMTNTGFINDESAGGSANVWPIKVIDANDNYAPVSSIWQGASGYIQLPLISTIYLDYDPWFETHRCYNAVVEFFTCYDSWRQAPKALVNMFFMPLGGGHINKHLPMFY